MEQKDPRPAPQFSMEDFIAEFEEDCGWLYLFLQKGEALIKENPLLLKQFCEYREGAPLSNNIEIISFAMVTDEFTELLPKNLVPTSIKLRNEEEYSEDN